MQNKIIGREKEIDLLNKYAESGKAEFVAVYGRRRVGKTFLVNQVFKNRLTFSMTGVLDGDKSAQIHAFTDALDLYGQPDTPSPKNWYEAFQILRHFLTEKMSDNAPCIIFIDELPCFETRKSDFVNALCLPRFDGREDIISSRHTDGVHQCADGGDRSADERQQEQRDEEVP